MPLQKLSVYVCTHSLAVPMHTINSFLPAYVATKAPLELPRHAWTSVVAAKEGKKLLGYSKTCLRGCGEPNTKHMGYLQRGQRSTADTRWALHLFFSYQ